MDIREVFALNLRRARNAKGLSQEALAHEADVDRTYVSALERLVSVSKLLESSESFGFKGGGLIRGGPPMWTLENRPKYNRDHLRYPSDLTDDEWAYIKPLIPPAKPGGGKRRTDMRAVMNGVMYILSTGCQWRYLPKDFPPYSTTHRYFVWWQCDGVLDRIHHVLYVACREKAEREASPTAAIIDSQSVKSAEKGGPASIRMAMMRAKRSRARSAISW